MSTEHAAASSGVPDPIDPVVVEAFASAQARALQLLADGKDALQPGTSEAQLVSWYQEHAPEYGFTGWFDRPYVRFNSPAVFRYAESDSRVVAQGTMVEVLLQPATDDAYACAGSTWVQGGGEEPDVLIAARELCRGVVGFSSRFKCVGEVYVFAQSWSINRRMHIDDTNQKAIGHLGLPPTGLLATGWPASARLATYMKRNQVEFLNYRRMHGIFCLRPRIFHTPKDGEGYSAMFAEMVFVEGEDKRIMGRSSIDEVGTL